MMSIIDRAEVTTHLLLLVPLRTYFGFNDWCQFHILTAAVMIFFEIIFEVATKLNGEAEITTTSHGKVYIAYEAVQF